MAKKKKKSKSKKKQSKKISFWRFIFRAFVLVVVFIGLFFGAIYVGFFGVLPSKTDLASIQQENASVIYSAEGKIIGKIFAKNRTQVDSSAMPSYLLHALVATEDKRFYDHEGVDYTSYLRVLIRTIILRDKSGGGGSTITQQIVKNLYGRPRFGMLSMPIAKVKEAIIATRLEEIYTKTELLVLYFNTVPFGENTWGIEAAAQRYFNKSVANISVPQAALLVGMLKANTAFNPRLNPEAARKRRNTVLQLMMQEHYLSQADCEMHKASDLALDYTNYALYNPSGHFVYKVSEEAKRILADFNKDNGEEYDVEKDGLRIKTTLNFAMQKMAVESIKKQLIAKQKILHRELQNSRLKKEFYTKHKEYAADTAKKSRLVFSWNADEVEAMTKMDSAWAYQEMLHASMYAVHPQSGEILVWVGGNNFRYLPYDLVTAKRQTASAFKPIVYAAAVENGANPCDYFNNEPVVYEEFDNWAPQNYSGSGEGEVAMWYALQKSLNIPSVDVYMQTGHRNVRYVAKDLGLELPQKVTPAIALGAESFSLQQLTSAYAAFANNGVLVSPYFIDEITDRKGKLIYKATKPQAKRAVTPVTAQVISSMLVGAVQAGTGRKLHSTYGVKIPVAGKTGTSQNYSDAWFVSYNQDLACGVWVGAMSPSIHFRSGGNGSGSALAMPIAARFYKRVETSRLRNKYMTGFSTMPAVLDSFGCEGWREKGLLNRVFDGVFQGEQRNPENTKHNGNRNPKTPREEKKKKGFFERIFNRKK